MSRTLHILEATLYASVWLVALFIGLVSLVLTGCGGSAHATPQDAAGRRETPPTIIIHTEPAPPPAEEAAERVANPPVVLRDVIEPKKAAVRLDANTYRACTCGDNCRCANCPDDCNTLARGDCPGGVCRVPQRSVLTRSTANHAGTAGGDCAASGGLLSKAKGAGGKVVTVAKRAAKVASAPVRWLRNRR